MSVSRKKVMKVLFAALICSLLFGCKSETLTTQMDDGQDWQEALDLIGTNLGEAPTAFLVEIKLSLSLPPEEQGVQISWAIGKHAAIQNLPEKHTIEKKGCSTDLCKIIEREIADVLSQQKTMAVKSQSIVAFDSSYSMLAVLVKGKPIILRSYHPFLISSVAKSTLQSEAEVAKTMDPEFQELTELWNTFNRVATRHIIPLFKPSS
jgi:hypothetical protein